MEGNGMTEETSSVKQLQKETIYRSKVIGTLQTVGAGSVFASRLCYAHPFPADVLIWSLATIALVLGVIFLIAANFRLFAKPVAAWPLLRQELNDNPVEESGVITSFGVGMMIFDAVACAVFVTFSGGLFQSVFSPLLLAIFSTALTLRLPRRALLKVIVAAICSVSAALATYELTDHFQFLTPIRLSTEMLHRGHYKLALGINLLAAGALTLVGGIEWMRNPIPSHLFERSLGKFGDFVSNQWGQKDALRKGIKMFAADVGRRPTEATFSQVHELGAIIDQAVILNLPYQNHDSVATRRSIAYLTFAAHWIDDFFDKLFDGLDEIPWRDETTDMILKHCRHLDQLRKHIF